MTLKTAFATAQKFTMDNSPAILTAIGVAGTVTTAILAGKASYSAALRIAAEEERRLGDVEGLMDAKTKAKFVYKEFIPAAVVGTVTLLAIIGANHVSTKRAAALAAAFKISEQMAEDYRQKTVEKLGKKAEEEMRSEIAADNLRRHTDFESLVITGSQEIFYDAWSGRTFVTTRERVHSAFNQLNYQIVNDGYAALSELYDLLGLTHTAISDEFGWNQDELIDPYYTATLVEGGRAAIEIRYNINPFRHFNKIGC